MLTTELKNIKFYISISEPIFFNLIVNPFPSWIFWWNLVEIFYTLWRTSLPNFIKKIYREACQNGQSVNIGPYLKFFIYIYIYIKRDISIILLFILEFNFILFLGVAAFDDGEDIRISFRNNFALCHGLRDSW